MLNGSLETKDLRLVLAIAEAGGATRAARLLHLSQSAVSHQLRGLEQRLGQNVFERSGKRLSITPAGERLLQLARDVLRPIALAEQELRRGVIRERTRLRLATQCYTAYHWLPPAISALAAEHPNVELSISNEAPADFLDAIDGDGLDLGLCIFPPRGARLERMKLFDDELVLAVPRTHPLAKKPFVTGADLVRETLIMNEVASAERERVRKTLFRRGEQPAGVMRVPFSEAIVELVSAGLGVSIMASFTLRAAVRRGDLDTVRLTRHGLRRTWSGVFRRTSPLKAAIVTLLEAVKRQGIVSR
jgi:LysR family transcriptional regulator, regulator for metE and metH